MKNIDFKLRPLWSTSHNRQPRLDIFFFISGLLNASELQTLQSCLNVLEDSLQRLKDEEQ